MKLLVVIGTRPEAIKMAPLIRLLNKTEGIELKLCNTGQHKELIEPILTFFGLHVDFDLQIMKVSNGLHELTANIISKTKELFDSFRPDYVLVHGDTTTSFAASLSAFYCGSKVAHVEAGLRTYNKLAPFPEEINRRLTAQLADVHFAPTEKAKVNLLNEGIIGEVVVTGNTVIDALMDATGLIDENADEIKSLRSKIIPDKKIILFTGHRRENFGEGFDNIFSALLEITEERKDVQVIYPVHLNPNVKKIAEGHFGKSKNVILIEPLSYGPFVWLMKQSYIILTDSGGIQEEAPSLGKPVLVLRDVTERPEAVSAGTVIIVGTDKDKIIFNTKSLLDDQDRYHKMSMINNPYGDGKACERILDFFRSKMAAQF